MIELIQALTDLLLNNLQLGIALIVLGTVEAIKQSERVNKQDLPFIAGVVGLFIGFAMSFGQTEISFIQAGQIGLLAGFASCGLFDFFKTDKTETSYNGDHEYTLMYNKEEKDNDKIL